MRSWTVRLVVFGLVAAACSSDGGETSAEPQEDAVALECEIEGYPCSLPEVPVGAPAFTPRDRKITGAQPP